MMLKIFLNQLEKLLGIQVRNWLKTSNLQQMQLEH